jgi:hypothetical protein
VCVYVYVCVRVCVCVLPAQKTLAELSVTKSKLADANANILALQRRYELVVEEEASLEARLALCKLRANNAAKLTRGLEEEATRWQARLDATNASRCSVVGDTVISVATACYAAPFPPDVRDRLVGAWVAAVREEGLYLPEDPARCRLSGILGDPVRQRQWRLCGLPVNVVADENAIMLLGGVRPGGGPTSALASGAASSGGGEGGVSTSPGSRSTGARVGVTPLTPLWPLIIDPQGQASR